MQRRRQPARKCKRRRVSQTASAKQKAPPQAAKSPPQAAPQAQASAKSRRTVVVSQHDMLSYNHRLALAAHFMQQRTLSVASSMSASPKCTMRKDDRFLDELDIQWAKGGADKASASASVVIDAILRAAGNPHVFIKLAFGTRKDALYYERLIYCKVTQKLLTLRYTPCIVPFIGYVQIHNNIAERCIIERSTAVPTSSGKLCVAIAALLKSKGVRADDLSVGHALITEVNTGTTLGEWLQQPRTVEDWEQVYFQLIYTLQCFAEIGLTHWDLHSGNAFVEMLPTPVASVWCLGNGVYKHMRSRWLLKIYDFDRSSKLAAPLAPGLEEPVSNRAMETERWMSIYGDRSIFDPHVDYARVTVSVMHHPEQIPLATRRLLHDSVAPLLTRAVEKTLSHSGTLCYKSSNFFNSDCLVDPARSATLCQSPRRLIDARSKLLGSLSTSSKDTIQFIRSNNVPTATHVFALPMAVADRVRLFH